MRRFALLLLLLSICAAQVAPAAAPMQLSDPGTLADAPRIAAAPGGALVVVWRQAHVPAPGASPVETIVARERRDGVWLEPHELALAEPAATLGEPAVALNDAGEPTVAWVVTATSGQRVDYAFRTGDLWVPAATLGRSASLAIERPVVALRPGDSSVFFAWQERRGTSQYRIRTLVIGPGGISYPEVVAGRNSMNHVVYPELLSLPAETPGAPSRMGICWFDLSGGQPRLDLRIWQPGRHDWLPQAASPEWPPEALASLPLVSASADLPPVLVGYYAPSGGSDRIFLAGEDVEGLASLDASPECHNRAPRVSRPFGGRLSIVWRQESAGQSRLMQGIVAPPRTVATLPLAQADPFSPPEADTALTAQGVLCVWSTPSPAPDAPSRFLPTVFFQDTPVEDFSAWRTLTPATAAAR